MMWTKVLCTVPLLVSCATAFSHGPFRGGRSLVMDKRGRESMEDGGRLGGALSRAELVKGGAATGVVLAGSQVLQQAQARDSVLVRRPVLPSRIFDTKRKTYLPVDAERLVHNKALDEPVVCIGEHHADPFHHKAQLEVLKAVVARSRGKGDQEVALGMEMFYRQHQHLLDNYIYGSGTLASLKKNTRWEKTWGHKLSLYAKILQYAKANQIRLVGLNVPVPVVQVVRRMGLDNVPSELKSRLPEVDLSVVGHRESFMNTMMMFGGAHGKLGADVLGRLYEAQCIWDEYMAESASNYLNEGSNRRMVIMAGTGHIENRWGVPDRITKRTGSKCFTVVPVTTDFDELGLPEIDRASYFDRRFADWIYYIGENQA